MRIVEFVLKKVYPLETHNETSQTLHFFLAIVPIKEYNKFIER